MAIALPESRQTFLLGHRSPNFWTYQSCSLSSNCFFECEHPFIDNPLDIAEPTVATTGLGSKPYPSNLPRICSTKISFDSSRVFLKYAKIQQEKERLCWQGETPPEASKRRRAYSNKKHGIFGLFSVVLVSVNN